MVIKKILYMIKFILVSVGGYFLFKKAQLKLYPIRIGMKNMNNNEKKGKA